MPTLLYLHGFNSSPESAKAQQTQQWFGQNAPGIEFICPSLPPYADQAMALLCEIVEARLPEPVFVIGSSMGGFFASCLAERYAECYGAVIDQSSGQPRSRSGQMARRKQQLSQR